MACIIFLLDSLGLEHSECSVNVKCIIGIVLWVYLFIYLLFYVLNSEAASEHVLGGLETSIIGHTECLESPEGKQSHRECVALDSLANSRVCLA